MNKITTGISIAGFIAILVLSYLLYSQIQQSAELSSNMNQLQERVDQQENQLQEYLTEQQEISRQNLNIRNELSAIKNRQQESNQFLLQLRDTDEEYNDWRSDDLPDSIVDWLQQHSSTNNN